MLSAENKEYNNDQNILPEEFEKPELEPFNSRSTTI